MEQTANWATVAVTLVLGVAGFAVAHNIRRDVRLRLAERRLAAYERLWALMRPASGYDEPLSQQARLAMCKALTDWYYANGDGMLLERESRTVFLEARDNLVRPIAALTPAESRLRLEGHTGNEQERHRGLLAKRQLSLLRSQLRGDLAIYGRPYGPQLDAEDWAFLAHCGVNLGRRPWKRSSRRTRQA
ncbi:hypothetical protein AB0K00_31020 [Dactylosporangium sp. NPDC049525]|uniref:hypothetical protein n=1 Tax=Dactylosporangium sp. NPDC049525 TaxID=3154730 RepID=UPI003435B227